MKYLLVVFLVIFEIHSVESQTKKALIIGIGAYPAESGWSTIHGDNDVSLIANALIWRGFNPDKIVKLINEQATKTNITKSFNQFVKQAKINDTIYIHFSTHGQQVIDTDGDEADGLDEAVIPFDACKTFLKGRYEGKNHLIDDELYHYLTSLRVKIGKFGSLVVVFDACHSGDASRGKRSENDSVIVRGTTEVFQARTKKTFIVKPSKLIDWVEISATQAYQNNYEYKVDGTFYGSLSYAIKLSLPDLTNEDDFTAMFKIIQKRRADMNVANYPQRPMIQGDSYYLKQKVF